MIQHKRSAAYSPEWPAGVSKRDFDEQYLRDKWGHKLGKNITTLDDFIDLFKEQTGLEKTRMRSDLMHVLETYQRFFEEPEELAKLTADAKTDLMSSIVVILDVEDIVIWDKCKYVLKCMFSSMDDGEWGTVLTKMSECIGQSLKRLGGGSLDVKHLEALSAVLEVAPADKIRVSKEFKSALMGLAMYSKMKYSKAHGDPRIDHFAKYSLSLIRKLKLEGSPETPEDYIKGGAKYLASYLGELVVGTVDIFRALTGFGRTRDLLKGIGKICIPLKDLLKWFVNEKVPSLYDDFCNLKIDSPDVFASLDAFKDNLSGLYEGALQGLGSFEGHFARMHHLAHLINHGFGDVFDEDKANEAFEWLDDKLQAYESRNFAMNNKSLYLRVTVYSQLLHSRHDQIREKALSKMESLKNRSNVREYHHDLHREICRMIDHAKERPAFQTRLFRPTKPPAIDLVRMPHQLAVPLGDQSGIQSTSLKQLLTLGSLEGLRRSLLRQVIMSFQKHDPKAHILPSPNVEPSHEERKRAHRQRVRSSSTSSKSMPQQSLQDMMADVRRSQEAESAGAAKPEALKSDLDSAWNKYEQQVFEALKWSLVTSKSAVSFDELELSTLTADSVYIDIKNAFLIEKQKLSGQTDFNKHLAKIEALKKKLAKEAVTLKIQGLAACPVKTIAGQAISNNGSSEKSWYLARQYFQSMAKQDPSYVDSIAYKQWARAALNLGYASEAESVINHLLSQPGERPDALMVKGEILLCLGPDRLEDALRCFELAGEMANDYSVNVNLQKARALMLYGTTDENVQQAMDAFSEVLVVTPAHSAAHRGLCTLLLRQLESESGEEESLKKLCTKVQDAINAYFHQGNNQLEALYLYSRFSLLALSKGIKSISDLSIQDQLQLSLIGFEDQLKYVDEATGSVSKEDLAEYYMILGLVKIKLQDTELANKYLEKAFSLNARNKEYLYAWGKMNLRLAPALNGEAKDKAMEIAHKAFRAIVQNDASDTQARLWYAVSLWDFNKESARGSYQSVVSITDAKMNLDEGASVQELQDRLSAKIALLVLDRVEKKRSLEELLLEFAELYELFDEHFPPSNLFYLELAATLLSFNEFDLAESILEIGRKRSIKMEPGLLPILEADACYSVEEAIGVEYSIYKLFEGRDIIEVPSKLHLDKFKLILEIRRKVAFQNLYEAEIEDDIPDHPTIKENLKKAAEELKQTKDRMWHILKDILHVDSLGDDQNTESRVRRSESFGENSEIKEVLPVVLAYEEYANELKTELAEYNVGMLYSLLYGLTGNNSFLDHSDNYLTSAGRKSPDKILPVLISLAEDALSEFDRDEGNTFETFCWKIKVSDPTKVRNLNRFHSFLNAYLNVVDELKHANKSLPNTVDEGRVSELFIELEECKKLSIDPSYVRKRVSDMHEMAVAPYNAGEAVSTEAELDSREGPSVLDSVLDATQAYTRLASQVGMGGAAIGGVIAWELAKRGVDYLTSSNS